MDAVNLCPESPEIKSITAPSLRWKVAGHWKTRRCAPREGSITLTHTYTLTHSHTHTHRKEKLGPENHRTKTALALQK